MFNTFRKECNCNLDYLLEKNISYICKYQYGFFLNKPNVQAVGLGFKEINGMCTFQKCIKVFLSKKLPENCLTSSALIPKMYNGIITDTVEIGAFSHSQLVEKIRPVLEGYSIGPAAQNTAGTFGCLVRDLSNNSINILSCNHVLYRLGLVPIGAPILQPGMLDGGKINTDVIATLSKAVPIKYSGLFSSPTNLVDAAIAKVSNSALVSNKLAMFNSPLRGIDVPVLGEPVFKLGRSTGYTKGIIIAKDVTEIETYPKGKAMFKNQIVTNNQSAGGDSGAIIFNQDLKAIGMLSMSNTTGEYSTCNLFTDVLQSLNIELVL